jgi:2-polyprenyl-6-methoxyphenol hydroxylase-like FAD-dependent oxidoreductase
MAPWGVAELQTLGLHERLLRAGGHHLTRSIGYDELLTREQAEGAQRAFGEECPGVAGPLCLEHVVMQNVALAAAEESGARMLRGVSRTQVTAGANPSVTFEHEQVRHEVRCRWIVGADGRTSTVRRQLGIQIREAPLDHLIVGLLVDGADEWPEDLQCLGKFGDLHYLVFPQGGGKVRLYGDYAYAGRARFTGEQGAQQLLAAFDIPQIPNSGAIANARPIGPCRSYPSQDAWVDEPCAEGVVLIGDAAGYNDPILGQGLSVTLRDARSVAELLTASLNWSEETLQPYVEERRERLRRLRFTAAFVTTLNARFGAEDLERRARAFGKIASDPSLLEVTRAAFAGPETVPAGCFTPEYYAEVFGTTEHLVA